MRDRLAPCFTGLVWRVEVLGQYTIASGYQWLMGEQQRLDMQAVVWHRMVLPRHAFIMWLAIKQRLFTMDHLSALLPLVQDTQCVLCEGTIETHLHLFFECTYSRQLLRLLCQWLRVDDVPQTMHCWRHWMVHALINTLLA